MSYTKGGIAGGWIHVRDGITPIALVHPKYVDEFIAAPALYEALEGILIESTPPHFDDAQQARRLHISIKTLLKAKSALALAEGKVSDYKD